MVVHSSDCNHVDKQATIQVQRICNTPEWNRCQAACLQVASWLEEGQHKPPVRHQPMTRKECMDAGLPYGFDGDMYAFGKHVYQYSGVRTGYGLYEQTLAFDPELRIILE